MSLSLSQLYNESYHHAVSLNLQQKGSKLSNCVRFEFQNSDRGFYDQIGPTEAVDITTSHADTPIINTKFDRRMVLLKTSDWADLIDKEDLLHLVEDPTSSYAQNAAYALGRVKDRRIIEAALGESLTGVDGSTKVALPASQTIAVNYGDKDGNPCGLTVEKLRLARQMLDDSDVDDDEEQYCVVTAKQIADLLRSVEVTSDDYNTVKALVDGKLNTFLGFTFKRVSSSLLPIRPISGTKNTKNVHTSNEARSVICFAKSGLLLAMPEDIKTDISYRRDKRMSIQVYASLSCGATRMNEKKVVTIQSLEQ